MMCQQELIVLIFIDFVGYSKLPTNRRMGVIERPVKKRVYFCDFLFYLDRIDSSRALGILFFFFFRRIGLILIVYTISETSKHRREVSPSSRGCS